MRSKERQSQQCHGTSTAKRKAQGGVFCGRKARIKLSMAELQGTGQYGDAASPRPFGVQTTSMAMHGSEERLVHWIVESTRHVWEFVSRQDSAPVFAKQATPAEPWTRVNNCTDKSPAYPDTSQLPVSHSSNRSRKILAGGDCLLPTGWKSEP